MTIETRETNHLGPAKFRTQADNNTEQICYYNRNKKDKTFNSFLVVRKHTQAADKIIFSIVKTVDKTKRKDAIYTDIGDELHEFNNDIVQLEQSVEELVKATVNEKQSNDTPKMIDESAKSQDFFQSNKDKIERKYTTTMIKLRNFLSNIAYIKINRDDFYDENFIFDVYLLITKIN